MAIIDRGEILLEAEPLRAIGEVRGRIWRRIVEKGEIEVVEREHPVISTKLLAGRTMVHVYAESAPGAAFVQVEPDLDLHYRKGAVVMYSLKDYIGEERVNGALRCVREAPLPTSALSARARPLRRAPGRHARLAPVPARGPHHEHHPTGPANEGGTGGAHRRGQVPRHA